MITQPKETAETETDKSMNKLNGKKQTTDRQSHIKTTVLFERREKEHIVTIGSADTLIPLDWEILKTN